MAVTLAEQRETLEAWKEQMPASVRETYGNRDVDVTIGERHGSWFIRVQWMEDGDLLKIAELALTNPEATADLDASWGDNTRPLYRRNTLRAPTNTCAPF
jgi:hypothetical protein